MKTVATICEYNPFHRGHEYHLSEIKRQFGEDIAVIAIMSGNYTQRGEIAIADKYLRAECAVRAGVNLVLELPFPHSSSSAEFFASAGVKIADSIGVVDYLSFGSEIGDISLLSDIAQDMSSDEYKAALSNFILDDKNAAVGYPRACECVYEALYNKKLSSGVFSPNNITSL